MLSAYYVLTMNKAHSLCPHGADILAGKQALHKELFPYNCN